MIVAYAPGPVNESLRFMPGISQHPLPCVLLDYCGSFINNQSETCTLQLIDVYSKFQKNPPLLIIHSTGEAPTIDNFPFIKTLRLLHPTLKILHLTTGWDSVPKEYTTITNFSTFFWPINEMWKDSFSHQATHHFIALARFPRYSRTKTINEILNRNLQQWGYFSIGSGEELYSPDFFERTRKELGIDDNNLKYFPSYVDGIIPQKMQQSYLFEDDKIRNALINVVFESSFEYVPDIPRVGPSWTVPMITEKTVKAFALGQIPIILGPPGQVEKTRQLGFDLFDDLINHRYDKPYDYNLRIKYFVDSLERFVNRTSQSDLQNIKQALMPRFINNLELAKKLSMHDVTTELVSFLDNLSFEKL